MRQLLLASLITASAASFVGAQDAVVIGQVVVRETGSPLGYSVVRAASSALLTGESGKFLLRDLGPGPVKITVKHIGFSPRDTTITLAGHDTVRLEVKLSQLVIQLPAMLVSGQCTNETPKETPPLVLAELFEQVRQNAERYRLLASAQPFALRVLRIRGYRNADGRVVSEMADTVVRDAFPAGPYEPKRVVRKGVGEYAKQWTIAVPELPDLADTSFLNNHCFRYAGKTRALGDSVIRVDYEPVPWLNKEVDISGTLYLNSENYQLLSSVTALNRIPSQFYGTGMLTLAVTARFSEIVPGVPVLDEWVLESKYRSKRQPPTVETGQIFGVVFTTPVKPDMIGRRR